jgi:hypothetical protein
MVVRGQSGFIGPNFRNPGGGHGHSGCSLLLSVWL